MAVGPLFKINEIVYLVESASLGELEAYRIGAIEQRTKDKWIYQVFIDQKAPSESTVGGRIDLKESRDLFYEEQELTGLCEAVDLAISNITIRTNRTQNLIATECEETGPGGSAVTITKPTIMEGDSKFNLNDLVYFRASAANGFLEPYKITNIHNAPNSKEFTYQLDLTTAGLAGGLSRFKNTIYFKERELTDKCEALMLIIDALDKKMSRLLNIKMSLCTAELTSGS